MPKVIVKASPAPGVPGRFVLGAGIRQKLKPDGSADKDANGNAQYWPARSGVFIPAGQDTELTITDEELKDLQSGANADLFMVQVIDADAQPTINEGGSSMATQNQPNQPQPGSTVPPGTTPQPTPTPAPTPGAPAPGTGTPSAPTAPNESSPATKRAK